MLSCRDPEKLGYHKYACPEHPEQYIVIPHSCKSRFCNSCGKVLTDKWVKKINSLFPNVSFHHLCFTLPQELRKLLKEYRFLLNSLFTASSKTVLSFCKERTFLPAIISSLHSFGKDLKESITHYLRKHPEEEGELRVFREKEVLDAFFDSFLKINWYVYDSTDLERRKVYRRLYSSLCQKTSFS